METEKQLNARFAKFSLKLFHETHFFLFIKMVIIRNWKR